MLQQSSITIFGGDGFIGRNLVKTLAKLNLKINIIYNSYKYHDFSSLFGLPGQVSYLKFENNKAFFEYVFTYSDCIINLIGILREDQDKKFYSTHVEIPKKIALYSSKFSIKKLIHVSALGVDQTYKISYYSKTKIQGETEVLQNFPNAIILRPSLVFGAYDKSINNLIRLAKILPYFPLINRGYISSQPIFVEDLTSIISKVIFTDNLWFNGKIFEIGGPDKIMLLDIVSSILKKINKKQRYLYINYNFVIVVSYLLKLINKFSITPDNLNLLLRDNIIKKSNLANMLNIKLTPIVFYINKIL